MVRCHFAWESPTLHAETHFAWQILTLHTKESLCWPGQQSEPLSMLTMWSENLRHMKGHFAWCHAKWEWACSLHTWERPIKVDYKALLLRRISHFLTTFCQLVSTIFSHILGRRQKEALHFEHSRERKLERESFFFTSSSHPPRITPTQHHFSEFLDP